MKSYMKVLPVIAAVAILGTASIGVRKVMAQEATHNTGLVQAIADTFGLDRTKVQSAVDDYRARQQTQRRQNMLTQLETRLAKAVSEGKITESQKAAVIGEYKALESKYGAVSSGMTPEQRRQKFTDRNAELQSWAKANSIDPAYLSWGRGPGIWGRHTGNTMPSVTPAPQN